MSIDATILNSFWQNFDAGQFAQAERIALHLAQVAPQSAEPFYLLGALYHTRGMPQQAVASYQQALQRDPEHASVLNNLGVLLVQHKQYEQAALVLREKVRLHPDLAEGYSNLANALAPQGLLDEAYALYQKAIELYPDFVDAHVNYGSYLLFNGQLERALPLLKRAVALRPDSWEGRINLGQALTRIKDYDAAIEHFQEAQRLRPDRPEGLMNLGHAHLEKKDYAAATPVLKECATKHPDFIPVYKQLGILSYRLQRHEEAVVFFRHFLESEPKNAEGHQNLGFVYTTMGRYSEALAHLREAIRLDPNLMEAHNSIGILHGRQGQDAESEKAFEEAIRIKPDHWELHSNRAMILLRHKRFEEGFPEYEHRTKILTPSPSQAPQWLGEPLEGKTILLTWEQGLGDTIHFIRFAALLKERGARVVAAMQTKLFPLLRSMRNIDALVDPDAPLPEHDYQVPLMSLPYRLGTMATPVPYLSADPALVERWREEIEKLPGKRVGICWQGDPGFMGDKHRSMPLRHFAVLAAIPGITLVSLQKYVGIEQIAANAELVPLVDLGPRLDNDAGAFMDTAAVMSHLDLVITSDTAVAHLAGALGVPVWLATSYAPDWRWFASEETSIWYPSMRIFRQSRLDVWDDVFAAMERRLRVTNGPGIGSGFECN